MEPELIDTGEKRDALGRRRTPAERRAELLEAYRTSGLTQRSFARREGINYTTFCTWAQVERRSGRLPVALAGGKTRRRPVVDAAAKIPFMEVQLSSTTPVVSAAVTGLEVRLPDGTLLRGERATELAKLVRALKA